MSGPVTDGPPVAGVGRRVLVTGTSGLLGRAVAQLLFDRGHSVVTLQRRAVDAPWDSLQGSVADPDVAARAVHGVDAIVHLAAKVSFTGAWDEFVATNIVGTRQLIAAARHAGVRDFVFVSSPSVAHLGASIVGSGAGAASPDFARGHYARSKAAAEELALAEDSPALRVTAIRPHIVWGPGDTQLVERVVERARAGRLPLLDGGRALIDTTYVDNAAAALVAAL
ncbi:MAG: NAD-dependent epimerase/dehydratase family protein, partial [Specibacter sp.]